MAKLKKVYQYFQPNKKDLKDKMGDCAIRCICKTESMEWLDTYDMMYQYSRTVQSPMNCKEGFEECVRQLGYTYQGISNKKGTTRPTVAEFTRQHSKGTYVCIVAGHYVAVVDGMFHDTWDSGDCKMYGYWIKQEQQSRQ